MRKIALSSMALLGLTRAQLFIYRSKTFTVHSVTPMNRLLTLVDDGDDNVVVQLDCVNDETGDSEMGPMRTYYNNIERDAIDPSQRLCPAAAFGEANRRSVDSQEPGYWKDQCWDEIADLPGYDNSADNNGGAYPWTDPAGGITCSPYHQLDITIYNYHEPTVSMTYNLDTWQYACIEDDYLSVYFGFGKREFFESKDLCFSNEAYFGEADEPPFVVNNNCYGPRDDGTSHLRYSEGEQSDINGGFWTCHDEGYRVDLHVVDNEEANEFFLKPRKIREPYMWVQIDFHRVKDYFQIFPEDKAKISFWKGQDENPSSVVISPYEDVENVCDPDRAADEIICENMSVFCESPDDIINLRIVAAGEILMYGDGEGQGQVEAQSTTCGEIVSGEFDFSTMSAALNDDPDAYAANLESTYYYQLLVNDHEEGAYSNAWFSFSYGTFERSNEKICFAGDFYPYMNPSCYLQNSGYPVSTQMHNPHEYAMDDFIQEVFLNQGYEDLVYAEMNVNAFNMGDSVDITNQLQSAVQGYVDLDDLDDAVTTSITINSLPSCGSLWRLAQTEQEESFAVFWSYDEASGFVVQAAQGDEIDFSVTSLYYEDDANCGDLALQFSYTVMGAMPVDGPTVVVEYEAVETLYLADYQPTSSFTPENPIEGMLVDFDTQPPHGIYIASCQARPCAEDEDPVFLEVGDQFNPTDGWYFLDTVTESYSEDGQIKAGVYQWLLTTFCEWMGDQGMECPAQYQQDTMVVDGIDQHGDDVFNIRFEWFPYQMDYYNMLYCGSQCFDDMAGGYDGTTEAVQTIGYNDYNIGQTGGQFIIEVTLWRYVRFMMKSQEDQASAQIEMQTWLEEYFGYFGSNEIWHTNTPWYNDQTTVYEAFIPRSPDAANITFNDYPPNGWIGYCESENCEGEEPTTIITGMAYNASGLYFVFYATEDALNDDASGPNDAVKAWLESYFVWWEQESSEPEEPSADTVNQILEAIGATGATLTVTMLYNAPVDLDLHFSCADGSMIYYGNTNNENCAGTLDVDMQASHQGNVRGDGSTGQIENISLGQGSEGHTYTGYVQYYSGSGSAPFQLIFSGTDPATGTLHVYEQQYVDPFESGQHNYQFTYCAAGC